MESRFEDLLSTQSPDAFIVCTGEGQVLHWSAGAESIFGYTAADVTSRDLAELTVPPELVAEHRRYIAATLATGLVTYESVRRRKDGSLLYVDVSSKAVHSAGHDGPLVLSAEKDVTDLKVARDANLMEARFRDLLESTPDGIVMANPTGHIVIANSQAERLFGYAPGELRGKSVDLLLPARYRDAHVGHRSQYFAQPRKRAMGSGLDLSGLRRDGTEFPIEISLSPLRTEESAFVMSAIRDISDRKGFEQKLRETNMELARANQAKDRFLASMSHELRTPLNAIIGFTGTLLMRLPGPLTADQEKQLRTVQGSARHLLALINDLLDVAKIEAGKVELEPAPVDCAALVDEVAATLRPQAEGKGLTLTVRVPQQAVTVHTDRRAVAQIIINLTGNAIKFTERGGIVLALSRHGDGAHRTLRISVEDTGPGIPVADQARLFTAFSRVTAPGQKPVEGTGLGLHLSQKLATLLGGRITLVSESGRGSTFTLTLPDA